MASTDRIYRRTEAGLKAFESQSPSVPVECRRILGLIAGETHLDAIRTRLRYYSAEQIEDWLDSLENLRLVESEPMPADKDLDFTGNFTVAELLDKKQDS